MKEITVLSGKGGAGKTIVTAALASVASNTVFCDNDVDAADLHLIFNPEIKEKHTFAGGWKASIDDTKCLHCGLCMSYCRFSAIALDKSGKYKINQYQCEGCRLCERLCPNQAIFSECSKENYWFISQSRFGWLVHAKMMPGEENSGKLVTKVRNQAKEIAKKTKAGYILSDGPPGIGCAAISSLSGTNMVVLVIEPTISGLHDLKRLQELVRSFNIQSVAVINKSDINQKTANLIKDYLVKENIPLVAEIPFDKEVVKAMTEGKNIVEFNPQSEIAKKIHHLWNSIK
jgi:MinD superfamily P-loop ATPase